MSASANEQLTTDDLKNWVINSIKLDLAYDEEDDKKAKEWDLRTVDDAIKFIKENKSEDLFKKLDNPEDPASYNCYFQDLKMRRVFYDLEYDRAREKLANPISRNESAYLGLRSVRKVRGEILDGIMWRCAAAISDLKLRELKAKSEEKKEEEKKWATLIALFHSELCASATQDVALGHANSFRSTVNKAEGYKVFDWIATHNIARGYNHLQLPLKAAEYIDFQVDEFPDKIGDLAKSIGVEKDKNILYRALLFPATRTFAQALGDVHRHTEQRYYLNRALERAKNIKADYWVEQFQLDLALEWRDSGESLSRENEVSRCLTGRCYLRARLEEAQHNAISACPESITNEHEPEGSLDDWKKSEKWLLGWLSADSSAFGRHLKTLASGMSELWKSRHTNNKWRPGDEAHLLESIVDVLKAIHANLERFGDEKAPGVYYLVPGADVKKSFERDRKALWDQGSALFAIIGAITKDTDDIDLGNLSDWEPYLKVLLEKDVFDPFRSEVMKAKLLKECQRSENCKQSECPVAKTKITDQNIPCLEHALPEEGTINRIDGGPLVSYDYYKSVMAAQQEHFSKYLKPRTGRLRSFRQGDAERPSPKFEIICLRRWNSFSPNLGSRAAATVGGGYFVRAWDKKRYIGIAIDPGYNFLENLFNEGFTIADIDLVVVTHAHPDHVENLTNLLTLLRERGKRIRKDEHCDPRTSPRNHKISLAVSEGVFERFERHFDNEKDVIREVVVLSAEKNCRGNDAGKKRLHLKLFKDSVFHMDLSSRNTEDGASVVLSAVRAWHYDGTGHDTIGVVVEHCDSKKKLGVIGDSRYDPNLHDDYKGCDVLVTHVGGLVGEDMYKGHLKSPALEGEKKFRKALRGLLETENHLYYPGIALLICDLQNNGEKFPLMILSEFGEELRGGLRKDLALRLSHRLTHPVKANCCEAFLRLVVNKNLQGNPLPIKPADVGLRIDIEERKIFCCICNDYYKPEDITPETVLPHEESMAYVCDSCRELRGGELTTLLEQWCSTTRPVAPLEYDKTLDD
jgi:ribonuclease BN (tRNA processing enzyme)